jgi:starvation-inducible DNA-binding protein
MSIANIGISDQDRTGVIGILSKLLADEYVLYTKTWNYHWNVVGPHFNDLHKFFEDQYNQLSDDVDDIAERIRSIGGKTPATLSEFGKNSRLDEHPGEYPDSKTMVSNLVSDHESIIKNLRTDLETCDTKFHDVGTNDFLTGLMEKHEKTAWMLRSTLED